MKESIFNPKQRFLLETTLVIVTMAWVALVSLLAIYFFVDGAIIPIRFPAVFVMIVINILFGLLALIGIYKRLWGLVFGVVGGVILHQVISRTPVLFFLYRFFKQLFKSPMGEGYFVELPLFYIIGVSTLSILASFIAIFVIKKIVSQSNRRLSTREKVLCYLEFVAQVLAILAPIFFLYLAKLIVDIMPPSVFDSLFLSSWNLITRGFWDSLLSMIIPTIFTIFAPVMSMIFISYWLRRVK